MTRLSVTDARDKLSETVNQVMYRGDRILLDRHGKAVAALVSIEDLELLEELENRMDLEDAREALREVESEGSIPWETVKARLGIGDKGHTA